MRKVIIITALAALSLLTACASKPEEKVRTETRVEEVIKERKVIIDTACDWVRPIYVHKSDVLTAGSARQILAHNETWESVCQKEKK